MQSGADMLSFRVKDEGKKSELSSTTYEINDSKIQLTVAARVYDQLQKTSYLPLCENSPSYVQDVTKFCDGMHWKSRIRRMQNCLTHTRFWCKIIRIQLLHKMIISIL